MSGGTIVVIISYKHFAKENLVLIGLAWYFPTIAGTAVVCVNSEINSSTP
jgi:hypothetical protein